MARNKIFMTIYRTVLTFYRLGLVFFPLACIAGIIYVFIGISDVAKLDREHHLLLIVTVLAYCFVIVLLAIMSRDKNELRKYSGALIGTGTFLPVSLIMITVVIYLIGWADVEPDKTGGKFSLFWGAAITVWLWFLSAFVYRQFADAKFAIHSSYGEFTKRISQVTAAYHVLCPEILGDPGKPVSCSDPRKAAACLEIKRLMESIDKELQQPGYPWVLATGYMNLWDFLYSVEEALIAVEPQDKIIEGALYDELRLEGSDINIKQRDELLVKLRQAVCVIDPCAKQFLKSSVTVTIPFEIITASQLPVQPVGKEYCQMLQATGGTPPYKWRVTEDARAKELEDSGLKMDENTGVLSGKPTKDHAFMFSVRVTDKTGLMRDKFFTLAFKKNIPVSTPQITDTGCIAEGRAVLRTVRRSLNEYRGELWNGLILARNRLFATMFITSLVVYGLLVVALSMNARKDAVFSASIFFLVGATIGLASRLRSESENKTGVYDYGLSAAGLITKPIFSGLTALGGVVLIAMLPYAGQILGPLHSSALTISTASSLPTGTVSQNYFEQLTAVGGTEPYKWASGRDANGAIPEGLAVSTDGIVSGTPTNDGTGRFTAQVTDGAGNTAKKKFIVSIKKAQPAPPLQTAIIMPSDKSEGPDTAKPMPSLNDIFNLRSNLGGLLIAVLFGFAPGLLFDRLDQMTAKYKEDLKSSQPTQGKPQI